MNSARLGRLAAVAFVLAGCSEAPTAPLGDPDVVVAASAAANTLGFRKLVVTTNANDGPGSLRAAFAEATADPTVREIKVLPGLDRISPFGMIEFSGSQPIDVDGGGIMIEMAGLRFVTANTVTIRNFNFEDQYSTFSAIEVQVNPDAVGTVHVVIADVAVMGSNRHAILVNDLLGYTVDTPSVTTSEGSAASVKLELRDVSLSFNGFAGLEGNGVRCNEGGAGSLLVSAKRVRVYGNANDGLRVDERGSGDVDIQIENSTFDEQGFFSSQGPAAGLRVDESGDGDVRASIAWSAVRTSTSTGIKIAESGAGSLTATLLDVSSTDNAALGIHLAETGAGDLRSVIRNGSVSTNGGDGIRLEEHDVGNLSARVGEAAVQANTGAGIAADQTAPGTGALTLDRVTGLGNGSGLVVVDPARIALIILP